MSRTRLDDPIHNLRGTVSTINRELEAGAVRLRRVERFQGSANGPIREAFFADLSDGAGFEIGKLAYHSAAARHPEACV